MTAPTASLFEKYICCAFTYNGIRKLVYTYDTKYKQKINNQIEERPILYSHCVIHFLFAGIMGIGMAPYNLFNDIERLEMKVRNIPPMTNTPINNYQDFYTVLWDQHKFE